jgi:ABC-type cobalt transport system substrate-binding protein
MALLPSSEYFMIDSASELTSAEAAGAVVVAVGLGALFAVSAAAGRASRDDARTAAKAVDAKYFPFIRHLYDDCSGHIEEARNRDALKMTAFALQDPFGSMNKR